MRAARFGFCSIGNGRYMRIDCVDDKSTSARVLIESEDTIILSTHEYHKYRGEYLAWWTGKNEREITKIVREVAVTGNIPRLSNGTLCNGDYQIKVNQGRKK